MTSNIALMILRIILVTALVAAIIKSAHAETCIYKSNDVGTIIGVGATKELAYSDAALQCFDRHEKLYNMVKKTDHMDTEHATEIIDLCVNIKCVK